jgi:hypothetical protein
MTLIPLKNDVFLATLFINSQLVIVAIKVSKLMTKFTVDMILLVMPACKKRIDLQPPSAVPDNAVASHAVQTISVLLRLGPLKQSRYVVPFAARFSVSST